MKLENGVVRGKGSRRNWKPKSSGTSGELAMMQALQSAGIPYRSQVPIKTKFKEWPFLIDFLIPSTNVNKYLALCLEVDGMLHFKTWTGKPAVRRMEKDRVKNECLQAEGYRVLRVIDTDIKKTPDTVILQIKEALAA